LEISLLRKSGEVELAGFQRRQEMTHGRTTKTRANSRSKSSRSLLTGVSEKQEKSLEARVARLERKVEAMQEEIESTECLIRS
jgi:hypothetical protein